MYKQLRILHAISTLSPNAGGPAYAVVAMARAVAALGHEVTIHATDHGMDGGKSDDVEKVGDGSLRIVVHQHLAPGSLTRHASIGLWRALADEIPKNDVVHLHSLYMFHDWIVWRECMKVDVPYILRPHGTLDPYMHRHHRWRKAIAGSLFQDKVIHDATLLHFTSNVERDLAQPYVFNRPGVVVPLGVDLTRFIKMPPSNSFRSRFPEIGNRQIILFLGRLNFKKGLEILIPAFAAALSQRSDLHLVIAGPDGGFKARARALVAYQRLDGRVTFTGNLDDQGVREAYAASAVFALPSRSENFANAAAEAMAAGLPSILSEEVQIARAAAREGACRIAPLTVSAWADAMLDLLSAGDAARIMGDKARTHAAVTFPWANIAKELCSMYAEAITRSGSPSLRGKSHQRAEWRTPNIVRSVLTSDKQSSNDGHTGQVPPANSKLKILHAISTLSPNAGGPAYAVVAMARAVAALGHEVTIHATDHGMDGGKSDDVEKVGDGSLRIVVHQHLAPGSLTRHASIGLWRALADEIPKNDVVHLHSLYMFHDWVVWRECMKVGVPYILQPHGSLDPFIHARHRLRKTVAERLFQDEVTRNAAMLQFTSGMECDLAQPFALHRPAAVVPLGVNLERFTSMPPASEFLGLHPEIKDRRIILFLGRLNFKKGLEILIPAFAAALSQRSDLHLVIAGPDGGFGERARALVIQHELQRHTTFVGNLDSKGVCQVFAAADIFALPSRTENFAIAAAEAMAAGVPSILSDFVQIAPAAARVGACYIASLEPSAWTKAILDLLSVPEMSQLMARRARKYAGETFAWAPIAIAQIKIYERALSISCSENSRSQQAS